MTYKNERPVSFATGLGICPDRLFLLSLLKICWENNYILMAKTIQSKAISQGYRSIHVNGTIKANLQVTETTQVTQ